MKSGYSLIELILVVGAMMLIAAFGVARYNEFNERQAVQQAADTFISNLRLIQAKALAGDKPEGCDTLVGWTVEFALKSYSMYAICNNGSGEEIIESTRVTVDLPGNVNLNYANPSITYYALGKGTSADQTVDIFGRTFSVPIVLASNSITKEPPTDPPAPVATPTPMPVSCPWPAGDPRCGDVAPPDGSTPTPTFESVSEEFACQAAGGTWQIPPQPGACPDTCSNFLLGDLMGACQETTPSCDCGASKCWDGATCVPNPTPTPTPGTCVEGYVCNCMSDQSGTPTPTGYHGLQCGAGIPYTKTQSDPSCDTNNDGIGTACCTFNFCPHWTCDNNCASSVQFGPFDSQSQCNWACGPR